jgi:hypothetical protein
MNKEKYKLLLLRALYTWKEEELFNNNRLQINHIEIDPVFGEEVYIQLRNNNINENMFANVT